MQMNDVRTSRTLVQIVHILRNYRHIKVFLQLGKPCMSCIRFHIKQLFTAFVIEVNHQLRITYIPFGTGYLHHRIFIPQSACITKRTNATLGTHSSTGQNH